MNKYKMMLKLLFLFFLFFPWSFDSGQCQEKPTKEWIVSAFQERTPQEWGERLKGVKTKLNTDQKVLALTFDACDSPKSLGYDAKLIDYLESEEVSATLFISGRWIDANLEIFKKMAENPLFEIENHGLNHQPCSANGRSAYGIEGTKSVGEIFDEIELNALKIETLTGYRPKYYRSATVYSDEICVEIAHTLGYEVVSFTILGDGGTTYSKEQVKKALLNSAPASIILMHMNHPERETAEGVIEAIPELKKRGFKFVKLSEYNLR